MKAKATPRSVPSGHAGSRRQALRRALGALAAMSLAGCDRLSQNAAWVRTLLVAQTLNRSVQGAVTGRVSMAQEFAESDIAAHFKGNGTLMPGDADYSALLAGGFRDWGLTVGGLVARPATYSLAQLRAMPPRTQITRHDCVEGWSAIGKWTGVPLAHLLAQVQPLPAARFVVFRCADSMSNPVPGAPDSRYYESIDLEEANHPQTLLAYALNGGALPVANGAPLRLRVERQLGYKHAKYLMGIELVDSYAGLRGGHGGFWEDRGYEWYAGI